MPPDPYTYMGQALAGRDPGDIDGWIESWHAGGGDKELPAHLGMTPEEYESFVLAPEALPHIITVRRMVEAARLTMLHAVAIESGGIN